MGIAVLLSGGEGDRYAVLHAVALSMRTGEVVHSIRQESSLQPPLSIHAARSAAAGQTLLLQLADSAAVMVRCHVLESKDQKELLALLREQRIFYLILGAGNEGETKRAEKRLKILRQNVANDRLWSVRSFWAVVARPGSEETMAAALGDHPDIFSKAFGEKFEEERNRIESLKS